MNHVIDIVLCLLLVQTNATNFQKFNECITNGKFEEAKIVLDSWGENKKSDPQYYICNFNYYINKSIINGTVVQVNPPDDKTSIMMVLKDPKTGNIAGYMIYKKMYNNEVASEGIKYIKEGIKKFPDHYEMRFGLLWALKEMRQLDEYLIELEDALKYVTNNNLQKVYWNNNESISNPHEFVIEKVQGSLNDIIDSNEIFSNQQFLHKYVDLMIQYFPKHKYGYADKGYIYLVNNDYGHALQYYLKANKIDESDVLILCNIGIVYKMLQDYDKAMIYFEKVIQIGNDTYFVNEAHKELDAMKKAGN
ncbi:MAG TPA: hypothetical protein PLZ38_09095 [Spirochaetota bacterium]|nr:hypothetical protein [Spirochaetota bacterium]HOM88672.1 hypothetical protein [Spirochaetota bacterium]HOR94115.1 hypothetical protein [Spirochaetota bacterium]HPD05526.1 hypothetical protein [Spirochaetota bacterium]HQG42956.1 hypothetical protein [Spirochaetota bacterium]